MNLTYLAAGVNAIICAAIVFICVCRLDKISKDVLLRVGLQYVVLLMAAASNGASPWLWEFPGWPTVFFSAAVLLMLMLESYQWRCGPPADATGPAPLSEH